MCVFTFKQPCILKELSFHGRKGLQGHQTEDSTKKRACTCENWLLRLLSFIKPIVFTFYRSCC